VPHVVPELALIGESIGVVESTLSIPYILFLLSLVLEF
jgi:hypothetical protein